MAVTPELSQLVEQLLPDMDHTGAVLATGQFHDVVLLPGRAAVRIARQPAASKRLPRRVALLARLSRQPLPFIVPRPLTPVMTIGGRTAVALSWVPGSPGQRGNGQPATLRSLLAAIAAVPLDHLTEVLDVPHAYAGRERWYSLLVDDVIPRLPKVVRANARRRIDAAHALPDVPARLVHGDLAGANVHWDTDGHVIGVLDWDLASPFDPAVDAACLAYCGWDNVRAAVDTDTYRRARVWAATFGIEQIAAAIENDESPDTVQSYVEKTTRWLTITT